MWESAAELGHFTSEILAVESDIEEELANLTKGYEQCIYAKKSRLNG